MTRPVSIGGALAGGDNPPLIIAGPCVLESEGVAMETAGRLKEICSGLGLGFVFKSSYDKANRTSLNSYRGPGIDKGLKLLRDIKDSIQVPVISDVHSVEDAKAAAEVLDALQIPAFLCRQTDILVSAARSGKPVNVKKGQFLAPWDVRYIIEKLKDSGTEDVLITERGTSFGYNNLVVDFRGLPLMRAYGYPVVFDVTHSLQLPGGLGSSSGGQREFAESMIKAAVAVGVDALFMEVHPDPESALCDGPNMIYLSEVERLLNIVKRLSEIK